MCVFVGRAVVAARVPSLSLTRHSPTRLRTAAEALRAFLKQLREALAPRLIDAVYSADGTQNKHWMAFSKRKFLNKEFA